MLRPEVFDILENTPPGRGGEIQLTDALEVMAGDDTIGGVYGLIFRGRRYDTGDKLSYLKAIVEIACGREDLGPAFSAWLKTFAGTLPE